MKKTVKITGYLLVATCFCMAACEKKDTLAVGKEYLKADSQLDALIKLDTGAADVSIIDSVMAGYYTSTGDYASKMQIIDGLVLAEEKYGIAGRKEDKAFLSEINSALISLYNNGTYTEITEKWGLSSSNALTESTKNPYENSTDDSWSKVKSSGKIVIGYTVFAPIAIKDETAENGLTGFDIELARAVAAYLNEAYTLTLNVEFQEIDWDSKETLLQNGTIDLIWNGLTITSERENQMCVSVPYLYNKQVAVIMKTDAQKYTNTESLKNAIVCAESGSAGESVVLGKQG